MKRGTGREESVVFTFTLSVCNLCSQQCLVGKTQQCWHTSTRTFSLVIAMHIQQRRLMGESGGGGGGRSGGGVGRWWEANKKLNLQIEFFNKIRSRSQEHM